MLNLKINNTFLKLLANQNISFDIKNLLFETDFIAGSRTSSFKIVNDAEAQKIFGFPEEIASKTQNYSFLEFDADAYFENTLLYRGKFKLRLATKTYYEGNFIFGISDLASQKDKTLAQILGNESYVFETNNLQTEMKKTLQLATPTLPNTSPIVFPVAKLENVFYNAYYADNYIIPRVGRTAVNSYTLGEGYPLPFIKVIFILELVIKRLGYTLITPNWTENYPDLRKLIFFATKLLKVKLEDDTFNLIITDNLKYGDYLPEMTLSELLNSLKNMFGLFFDFNSKYKTVKIFVINDLLQTTEYQDITTKVSPKHKVIPYNENKGFVFQFDKFDDDQITGYLEKPITDLSKFTYHTVVKKSDLPNPNLDMIGTHIYLVLSEHRYYYKSRSNIAGQGWEEWTYPWQDYYVPRLNLNGFVNEQNFVNEANNEYRHVKQGNELTIQTKFAPVASNKLWHFVNKKGKIERLTEVGTLNDGKIEVKIDNKQVYTKPAWFVFRDSKVYNNQYRNAVINDNIKVTANDTIKRTWVDANFEEDEQMTYTRLCEGGFIIAESDFTASKEDKPPIRILLFHGLQTSPVRLRYNEGEYVTYTTANAIGEIAYGRGGLTGGGGGSGGNPPPETGTRKYPMASSDCYDNLGNRIANFAIRWTGRYGLINVFWESIIKIKQQTRVFELQAVFTLEDLLKFEASRKIRIRETLFFIEKMETKIGEFIDFTTLTLIRVGSETQKAFVLEPPPQVPAAGFWTEANKALLPISNFGYSNQSQTSISIIFKNGITFYSNGSSINFCDCVIWTFDTLIIVFDFPGFRAANYTLVGSAIPELLPDTFYNLILTRDNGVETLYLNNNLIGTSPVRVATSAPRFLLGDLTAHPGTSKRLEVFDFKCYLRILTENERNDILQSNGAISPPNAFTDVPFNEREGSEFLDISGNNNHMNMSFIDPIYVTSGDDNHHIAEDSTPCE